MKTRVFPKKKAKHYKSREEAVKAKLDLANQLLAKADVSTLQKKEIE